MTDSRGGGTTRAVTAGPELRSWAGLLPGPTTRPGAASGGSPDLLPGPRDLWKCRAPSLQLHLFALVLLGLVGGLAAWFLAQKSVTLTVDGQSRTVHTYADTVAEVLDDEGLTTGVARRRPPRPPATLAGDGDTVVVNRARPLSLTVDGVQQQV